MSGGFDVRTVNAAVRFDKHHWHRQKWSLNGLAVNCVPVPAQLMIAIAERVNWCDPLNWRGSSNQTESAQAAVDTSVNPVQPSYFAANHSTDAGRPAEVAVAVL